MKAQINAFSLQIVTVKNNDDTKMLLSLLKLVFMKVVVITVNDVSSLMTNI